MEVRENLGKQRLSQKETEKGARPRTYLVITNKWKRVAQNLREIQDILRE